MGRLPCAHLTSLTEKSGEANADEASGSIFKVGSRLRKWIRLGRRHAVSRPQIYQFCEWNRPASTGEFRKVRKKGFQVAEIQHVRQLRLRFHHEINSDGGAPKKVWGRKRVPQANDPHRKSQTLRHCLVTAAHSHSPHSVWGFLLKDSFELRKVKTPCTGATNQAKQTSKIRVATPTRKASTAACISSKPNASHCIRTQRKGILLAETQSNAQTSCLAVSIAPHYAKINNCTAECLKTKTGSLFIV